MTVIALTALVVKAHDANTIDNINRSVLITMLSGRYRLGYFANHNVQDRTIRVDVFDCGDSLGWQIGPAAFTAPSWVRHVQGE
jgi:hypothetical protein